MDDLYTYDTAPGDPNLPERPSCEFSHWEMTLKIGFATRKEPQFKEGEIARLVTHILQYWSDGRYSFASEQVADGLTKLLKGAIFDIFNERARKQVGNEMVRYRNGSTSKAYLMAEEEANKYNFVDVALDKTSVDVRPMTSDEYYSL